MILPEVMGPGQRLPGQAPPSYPKGNSFMMFGMSPEDVPEEVRQQIDRQHAQRQAVRTELRYFMRELGPHKLWLLRMLFTSISHDEEGSDKQAAYWEGMITAYLEMAGVCPGCGTDHIAEEFPGTASPDTPVDAVSPKEIPREILLEKYNVAPDPNGKGVACKTCDMVYPSLEDRMIKETCHGCERKAAWG